MTARVVLAAAFVVAAASGCWWILDFGETTPTVQPRAPTPTPTPAPTKEQRPPRRRAVEPIEHAEADESDPEIFVSAPSGSGLADLQPVEPRRASAGVAVRVESNADGRPIAEATVSIIDADGRRHEAATDADGLARFADELPVGPSQIVVQAAGFAPRGAVEALRGGASPYGLQLAPATTVVGVVTDEEGRPVAGAVVRVTSPSCPSEAVSGSDGRFRLEGVPSGDGTLLTCSAPLHHSLGIKSLEGFRLDHPVEFRLAAAGRITGFVSDASGAPAAGATVRATAPDWSDASATADASGRYVFEEVALGRRWTLAAVREQDADSAPVAVAIDAADPERSVDLALRRLGSVVVSVTDETGRPTTAWIERRTADAPNDSDGETSQVQATWTIGVKSDAAWRLRARTNDGASYETTVDAAVGATRAVELRVLPFVAVTGAVVERSGSPVPGAYVWVRSARRRLSARARDDGTFRVDGVAVGPFRITAEAAEHDEAPPIDATAPAADVRVVAPRYGRVSLQIRPPSGGKAPTKATAWFRRLDDGPTRLVDFDAEGVATAPLVRGSWRATIWTDEYAAAVREFSVGPEEDVTPPVVVLDVGATLAGRVADDGGRAVAGASVYVEGRDAKSDAKGAFVVAHVPRRRVTAAFQAAGFFSQEIDVDPASPLVVTMRRF